MGGSTGRDAPRSDGGDQGAGAEIATDVSFKMRFGAKPG
jgi:hypothetical protein